MVPAKRQYHLLSGAIIVRAFEGLEVAWLHGSNGFVSVAGAAVTEPVMPIGL
jgi:hypothetical protein